MLKVNHLYKSYRSGSNVYEVLKDVNFEVRKGEFVAVMGPSGSVKTTLLNCISCFIPHDKGEILLDGTNISGLSESQIARVRNESLGFVFQDFMLLDGLTVFENVCVPKVIKNASYRPMEEKAGKLLKIFGISEIADKYPAEISGGQKQRAAVARALMNDPLLILADEPTGNLDEDTARGMVTHDSFSASFCDRVIVMKDGRVFREISRTGDRRAFMEQLLGVLSAMNGGDPNDPQ